MTADAKPLADADVPEAKRTRISPGSQVVTPELNGTVAGTNTTVPIPMEAAAAALRALIAAAAIAKAARAPDGTLAQRPLQAEPGLVASVAASAPSCVVRSDTALCGLGPVTASGTNALGTAPVQPELQLLRQGELSWQLGMGQQPQVNSGLGGSAAPDARQASAGPPRAPLNPLTTVAAAMQMAAGPRVPSAAGVPHVAALPYAAGAAPILAAPAAGALRTCVGCGATATSRWHRWSWGPHPPTASACHACYNRAKRAASRAAAAVGTGAVPGALVPVASVAVGGVALGQVGSPAGMGGVGGLGAPQALGVAADPDCGDTAAACPAAGSPALARQHPDKRCADCGTDRTCRWHRHRSLPGVACNTCHARRVRAEKREAAAAGEGDGSPRPCRARRRSGGAGGRDGEESTPPQPDVDRWCQAAAQMGPLRAVLWAQPAPAPSPGPCTDAGCGVESFGSGSVGAGEAGQRRLGATCTGAAPEPDRAAQLPQAQMPAPQLQLAVVGQPPAPPQLLNAMPRLLALLPRPLPVFLPAPSAAGAAGSTAHCGRDEVGAEAMVHPGQGGCSADAQGAEAVSGRALEGQLPAVSAPVASAAADADDITVGRAEVVEAALDSAEDVGMAAASGGARDESSGVEGMTGGTASEEGMLLEWSPELFAAALGLAETMCLFLAAAAVAAAAGRRPSGA